MSNAISKKARLNVLVDSNEGGKNFIHAILNAVNKGFADQTIIEDAIELAKANEVSKGTMLAAPDALREYAENYFTSLNLIADELSDLEFIEEQPLNVKKKLKDDADMQINVDEDKYEDEDEEIDEDEKEEIEEFDFAKTASVTEDWDTYQFDKESNKIAGTIRISFNKNMSKFKDSNNKIKLNTATTENIKTQIFKYLRNEYPLLKAKLSSNIFKGNLIFKSLEKGRAEIGYEIDNAY